MDRLILFRHGKAEAESESGEDFDRRLAPRGVEEAAQTAGRLAALGFAPDLALVSAAARTRGTWAAAAAAFPKAQVRFEDSLYNAASGEIRRAAQRAGGAAGTVMMIGHNPGLHELAVRLMLEGSASPSEIAQAQRGFPTAAAAVFEIDAHGRPSFDGLYLPERRG